ncbi:MAG: response regulator transcription factor [Anaerolineae bacterium]|jgi:two-component system response regulator NreC|nr:response regulator transcription factor [Anaerolineae bacterium]MBT4309706.1 response regulator transcription factor [Anaerolineae bacterium]MBT4456899.1 response regulator transcription factor [Anaerolineae bacterium]MBT4843747.1 response regulator transcription factor [Anaerolineae bacterium]MBT6062415.1 response regulator transcription factor [Anaerolineae bacterium]
MNKSIRVLIADDHAIVRSGVRMLLEVEPDFEVVGEAEDGEQAISLTEKLQPDIVLMDISMPGIDGLEATRQIKSQWPDINIVVLTMHRSEEHFFEMLKKGASGYLLKGAEPGDLIHALRVVSQGAVFIYPTMAQKLVQDYLNLSGEDALIDPQLSPRENEILELLIEGFSNKEIAEKLVVSLSTVHTHRTNIMHKLGLSNRHELIQYARRRGLL